MFIESAVKFRNISHKIYKHYQHNIQFYVQYFARDYVMTVQSNYTNFFQESFEILPVPNENK